MPLRIRPLSFLFLMLIVCSSSLGMLIGLAAQFNPSPSLRSAFDIILSYISSLLHCGIGSLTTALSSLKAQRCMKSEEVEVKKISSHRKLMFHSTTDYDDAGANPKHDPRRRPGGKP
ncbi:hypothetical protein HID58_046430 [Brassica napus]|uniref:Uncharacterized protein n=1 Tax=Brassica napus TaxID=3708 RepID=A0ABQ8AWJ5_BRANA|nr:hypothetical protein HID58_046430 [Brassica napus]